MQQRIYDVLDNAQTKPAAAGVHFGGEKGVENFGQLTRRYASSVVADTEHDVVIAARGGRDGDLARGTRFKGMDAGVGNQVTDEV